VSRASAPHILDGHTRQVRAQLDFNIELIRPLAQLRDQRWAKDLIGRCQVERPPCYAIGECLDRGETNLGNIVAVPRAVGQFLDAVTVCAMGSEQRSAARRFLLIDRTKNIRGPGRRAKAAERFLHPEQLSS
jgi:hypothetical protein